MTASGGSSDAAADRIRLSSNEAPAGPSPTAIEAAQAAVVATNRYPDDASSALRETLAAHEGVSLEQVAVGTGSVALLLDAIGHACPDGGEVLAFAHAFVVYRVAARRAGARYVEVADGGPATVERDGYARDPEALLDRITDATRIVCIDNPGNPTGTHLSGDGLRRILDEVPEHVIVAVDEAYHHFALGQRGYQVTSEFDADHPRLLTFRTFSKAHALAGMRVGYVVGPADLIAGIDGRRPRFNVSRPAQAAAIASLGDTEHLSATVEEAIAGRRRMGDTLRGLGVPFTDGLGNFLTIECGAASGPVVDGYRDRGIDVWPLDGYGLTEQIRVTVGTPEEVDVFAAASRQVLAHVAPGT